MVLHQRLLRGPATRAYGDPGAERRPRHGHARPSAVGAREAYTGGVLCMAAQLVNCVWLGVAWPHLATLTWHLALAFLVFVRLVQPEAQP